MTKKLKKQYDTPKKGWQSQRIEREKDLISDYQLKNKKEVWRAETKVRNFRRVAREVTATQNEQKKEELLNKVNSLGLISKKAGLDKVLGLTTEDILERRLQTIVYKRGLASTLKESRQKINHGKIKIDSEKVTVPSYLVKKEEEKDISQEKGGSTNE